MKFTARDLQYTTHRHDAEFVPMVIDKPVLYSGSSTE